MLTQRMLCAAIGVLAAALSGAFAFAEEAQVTVTDTGPEHNKPTVSVKIIGDKMLVAVMSPGGIGNATLRLDKGRWPKNAVVRLVYDADQPFERLEGFTADLRDAAKPDAPPQDLPVERVKRDDKVVEVNVGPIPDTDRRELALFWVDAYR